MTGNNRDYEDQNNWWSWETWNREFWNRPLGYPILRAYGAFMEIRRYDKMPFYFAPVGEDIVSLEDRILNYVDWLVDAHEEARNNADANRNFYQRSVYVYQNFLRYQNDTMCNMMFDVKAPKPLYDKLNSTISQRNKLYYASVTGVHMLAFSYLSFFFRYRRLGVVPTLVVSAAYYSFFENVNNILYKIIVDKPVMDCARKFGYSAQVQPTGSYKERDITFK